MYEVIIFLLGLVSGFIITMIILGIYFGLRGGVFDE